MKRLFAVLAALSALALAGCIDSAKPILTDAKPVFGPQLRFQFYGLYKGAAVDPEQADYVWKNGHYVHAGGGMKDTAAFSMHPFEGDDFIIQSVPADKEHRIDYALMHKLLDGVYHVLPVDENDASEAVRKANCRKTKDSSCRIETREQLFALARATAAKRHADRGGLAIRRPNK